MRASGVLMPVFSLPGPYGIGTLGASAFQFVDFLKLARQKYWQVLPMGPTGYGDSPYQSFSAFAANPYLIDPERLGERGLLLREEIEAARFSGDPERIDYEWLFHTRMDLLQRAVDRFEPSQDGYGAFTAENDSWLPDYALFMAVKEEYGHVSFLEWPEPVRVREEQALQELRDRKADRIRFWQVLQYLFWEQWTTLKRYANDGGIEIIGDIPIYVSPDSSDLWSRSELFQTDEAGNMTAVAGCPPDGFSPDGQLWGNPLYRWEEHARTGYQWWIQRLRHAGKLFDVVRIDHFRGFAGYYSIDPNAKTAAEGHWRQGPGIGFIDAVKAALPGMRIIAEDLGFLTPDVRELLSDSGYPGMKVLQFAFDSREDSDYLPHHYPRNCVVYTGTHDNTTAEDWKVTAPPDDVHFAMEYLHAGEHDFTRQLIRAAMASVGDTVIVPLADWLGLGVQARINTPSTLGGNWSWRVADGAVSETLAGELAAMTRLYGRA